nr:CmpA/NrtA family ABC transporter substrate-binding protein [Thiohalobacter thiocyanaticus]
MRFLHERHKAVSPRGASKVVRIPGGRPRRDSIKPEKHEVMLGFVPLTDCAPLVIAREKGMFKKHGLSVQLSKESSWASIRDKVCYGVLDGAQMLAAMPLTASVQQQCQPMVTAMSLSLGGNAVTVSSSLYALLQAVEGQDLATAEGSASALAQVIRQRRARGEPPLQFGVVYPESSHNYLLRYWMASAGIDPDEDVEIRVVPPPYVVDRLRDGSLSGYCVGEPWNAKAVSDGIGRVLTTTHAIWNHHPEKVFGVTRAWAEAYPRTHQAVLMALLEACSWLDAPVNRDEACRILSRPEYVDSPEEVLAMSLQGSAPGGVQPELRAPVFHRYLANQPWRSHATWFLSQMLRWGQVTQPQALDDIVASVYRPDLYREAAGRLGMPVSHLDARCEGRHTDRWWLESENPPVEMGADSFMDGRRFDPREVIDYIKGFSLSHEVVELATWRTLNPGSDETGGACHEQATGQ